MKTACLEISLREYPLPITINIKVPDDFYEWSLENQLIELANKDFFIDSGTRRVYNTNYIQTFELMETI